MNKLQNKLISIFINRFSGKVTLRSQEKQKELFFKYGEIIFAHSHDDKNLFLEILLSQIQLKKKDIEDLEAFNTIDEQQKYILKNNILNAKDIFLNRQKIVEESLYSTFFESYENITVEKEQLQSPLSFDIQTFPIVLRFIEKYAQKNDLIDKQQELYLSDHHKDIFANIKLKTNFRKVLDLLNQKKQSLESLHIAEKSGDIYTFLYFLFILGFIGQNTKATDVEASQISKSEFDLNTVDDLKERQVERLLKAPPHILIGADRNLSEAILYKNTIKLIKRYDIFSNLSKHNYKKFYDNLIKSLYILTSPEQSKAYYKAINNNEAYTLKEDSELKSCLLYTEAKFFFTENMLNEALEKVKKAIELAPKNNKFKVFMYEIVLYFCERNQKQPSEKIGQELHAMLEVDSTDKEVLLTLAQYYKMVGKKKKQLSILVAALKNDPEDLLLEKQVMRLKTQLVKNKANSSGIFKLEKSEKKLPFAGLFKKKDSKKKK
ncbi:hypothetical protein MRY82_00270 [bacterium]|nr:hypothetical protein [bacterium]